MSSPQTSHSLTLTSPPCAILPWEYPHPIPPPPDKVQHFLLQNHHHYTLSNAPLPRRMTNDSSFVGCRWIGISAPRLNGIQERRHLSKAPTKTPIRVDNHAFQPSHQARLARGSPNLTSGYLQGRCHPMQPHQNKNLITPPAIPAPLPNTYNSSLVPAKHLGVFHFPISLYL